MGKEIWKSVVGFENRYEVSDLGRVRNIKTNYILKPKINKYRGCYQFYSLYGDDKKMHSYSTHKLVLNSFVGKRPDNMQCCHNDGNPLNNELSNLRWDTLRNNIQDRERHGTLKLSKENVLSIRSGLKNVKSYKDIAKKYNIHRTTVAAIAKGDLYSYLLNDNNDFRVGILKGENAPNAKLTNNEVAYIKKMIVKNKPYWIINEIIELSKYQYYGIKSGKTWKHIKI